LFASFLLDGRSLENKNSVRFTETSREILESNDWIVQRLDGKIYPDKRLQPHSPESGRDARYLVGFFLLGIRSSTAILRYVWQMKKNPANPASSACPVGMLAALNPT